MDDVSPLEAEIRRRITAAGPMPVAEFMALCLTDHRYGYYTTRDPIGGRGDFITSPEISQMFGELIGLWMAAVWNRMGEPANVRVIELGPGRGTMMVDALRAAKVMPAFRDAMVLHLVEVSPLLSAEQERALRELPVPMFWHKALNEVPAGPAIIVANEFFDALPVNQAVKEADGWHERRVALNTDGALVIDVAPEPMAHMAPLPESVREAAAGSIFEWRSDTTALAMGRHIARDGGAALVIDYGHAQSSAGETLQAVGGHAYAGVLSTPGTIDLTAHVDFDALARDVEAMGAVAFGPIEQSEFLNRLGIETRAARLKAAAATPAAAEAIDTALARLTGDERTGMGTLFKAAAFAHPALGAPPGFETERA
jgi:NADH dehydrogenase [ubiquinone] 1 alpha subcomplex assembly factor 7